MSLYPIKCRPIYKEMIWGGNKLAEKYHRTLPSNQVGESWELTCRPNGMTVIENGEYAGWSIEELVMLKKEELLGDQIYAGEHTIFPLLIKFIDAKQDLSIQVHPDDEYAERVELQELGKTEAWYIIDAKPGSKLVYGLQADVSKENFNNAIKNNAVNETLNFVEVEPGDIIYIPAGTVHAIGKGLFICEIQQNSDITYRVYDYNRVDVNGNLRELHIDKALDVIQFSNPINAIIKDGKVESPYFHFRVEEIRSQKEWETDHHSFQVIIVLEGKIDISTQSCNIAIKEGETVLIPAALGNYFIDGKAKVIVVN